MYLFDCTAIEIIRVCDLAPLLGCPGQGGHTGLRWLLRLVLQCRWLPWSIRNNRPIQHKPSRMSWFLIDIV